MSRLLKETSQTVGTHQTSRGVNRYDLLSLQLKYEGKTYDQIVDELARVGLNVKRTTIEKWFYSKGRLYEAYRQYENEKAEEEKQRAIYLLKRYSSVSVAALIKIIRDPNSNDSAKVAAAKDVLDRTLGRAIQPTADITGNDKVIIQPVTFIDSYANDSDTV